MKNPLILALLGTFLIVVVDDATRKKIESRTLIGLLIGFLILSLIAEPFPKLAAALGFLIFVVTVLERGPRVLRKVA